MLVSVPKNVAALAFGLLHGHRYTPAAAQKFGFAVSDAARDQITFRRGARIIPAETGGASWGSAECRPRSFEEEITT